MSLSYCYDPTPVYYKVSNILLSIATSGRAGCVTLKLLEMMRIADDIGVSLTFIPFQ